MREVVRPAASAPGWADRLGRAIDAAVLAVSPVRGRARIEARLRAVRLSAFAAAADDRLTPRSRPLPVMAEPCFAWTGER